MPESIESSKFVSYRARMLGEFDLKIDSQSTKFKWGPQIFVKLSLFGAVKLLLRNTIKSKFTNNGWGIAFDGEGSWSFGNNFARNVVIFCVYYNSSSYNDYQKNKCLVFGEG